MDFFIKHSISKERLQKLIAVYACQFRDGRAQSAQAMRTGQSVKVTMAGAAAKLHTEVDALSGAYAPTMPHHSPSGWELDRYYSSPKVVDDVEFDDVTRLEDNRLCAAGMTIVQEIIRDMAVQGRTRTIPDESAQPQETR